DSRLELTECRQKRRLIVEDEEGLIYTEQSQTTRTEQQPAPPPTRSRVRKRQIRADPPDPPPRSTPSSCRQKAPNKQKQTNTSSSASVSSHPANSHPASKPKRHEHEHVVNHPTNLHFQGDHGGRHAGAIESESLGIPIDVIKRVGDWKDRLGRLETHYLGKLPSQFAQERNQVKPSIELQRTIFPWIEDEYGLNNVSWKKACLKEMDEVGENEEDPNDNDGVNQELEFVEVSMEEDTNRLTTKASSKVKPAKANRVVQKDGDTARRGFLKLLVRCRRIILQDAAIRLHYGQSINILDNRVFQSPEFKAFQ
ncbi:hypothetical protein BGZ65_011804, partial [Modicella reniformis]